MIIADIGREQWELLMCARNLRDTLRAQPDTRSELDDAMLDEAIAEVMGIIGDLSATAQKAARSRAREAA